MRVVYVSTIERGGPLTHLRQLAPRVAEEGVDVHVLCGTDEVAESLRQLGVSAETVPVAHKLDVRGAAAFWPRVRAADVVHTHDRRAGLFGRVAGRTRGAHVLHTLHGLPEEIAARVGREDAPDPPGVGRGRIEWLMHGYLGIEKVLSRLGHVVAPSQALAEFMLKHGLPARLLHVIPYGIAQTGDSHSDSHSDSHLVVGVAANLEYWKGVDVLLEAARLAQEPLRIEINGDGSLRGDLQRQAEEAGVEARFNGFVSEPLAGIDVLAQPSRADNLPLAVLEAMAAGLPVVATRVGGIPELVVDGETGFVVPAEDPSALAAALDSLARDRSRLAELGRRGHQRVATHFSAEQVARRTVELYRELCGSST
jgi:glycosyltransferase involved in cell wall biosynthesis